ncbi:hypothetical protein D3C76_1451190 [compost metagenome]
MIIVTFGKVHALRRFCRKSAHFIAIGNRSDDSYPDFQLQPFATADEAGLLRLENISLKRIAKLPVKMGNARHPAGLL